MLGKKIFFSLIASLIMLGIGAAASEAQLLFLADFEKVNTKAVPNPKVNDIIEWNKSKRLKGTVLWQEEGKGFMHNEVNGCESTSFTYFPVVDSKNWSDVIIFADFTWRDNDGWGFGWRMSDDEKGYMVHCGANSETPFVIVGLMEKGCGKDGQCFDGNCENAGFIEKKGYKGGFTVDETGKTWYRIMLHHIGDSLKVWFDKVEEYKGMGNDFVPKFAPYIDIKEGTHKKGRAGIWSETIAGDVDNVTVYGGAGLAVNAKGKIATSWGEIKGRY